jgi:hypothetical protein
MLKKKFIFASILTLILGVVLTAWYLSSFLNFISIPAYRVMRPVQIPGMAAVSIDALLNPPEPEPVDINKLRDILHMEIRHQVGAHHDAFIYLGDLGNKDSVPLLITALGWHLPIKDGNDYFIECTTVHCFDALRSLTNENFKYDQKKWQKWWDKIGNKLPADHFYPRKPWGTKLDNSQLRNLAWLLGLTDFHGKK